MSKTKALEEVRDLVYILAPSYTGSTLLTFLLSKHEDIATVGELKAAARGDLGTYLCSCGNLQRECKFWKRLSKEMQKTATPFALDDFGTHFRSDSFLCDRLLRAGVRSGLVELIRDWLLQVLPSCRHQLHNILERNRQIIEVICNLQHGATFVDGSKDPIRLKLLNSANYWNSKVIYLIRDGRGVANSYMRHYSVPMETAAREWRRVHRECDRVVKELGSDMFITIHYEDLCRDPEETMGKICDFLGLNADLGNLQFKSSEHHILGNQMRLRSTEEIRLDEKWKDRLTQKDLDVFDRIAGKANRAHGYRHLWVMSIPVKW